MVTLWIKYKNIDWISMLCQHYVNIPSLSAQYLLLDETTSTQYEKVPDFLQDIQGLTIVFFFIKLRGIVYIHTLSAH